MAGMSCSTQCPNCRHQFTCCTPPCPCIIRRNLSGGGLVHSPLPSPSAPLTFRLPPAPRTPPPLAPISAEAELQRLGDVLNALRLSGWYYENLTSQKSDALLKGTPVGTFLVRDSSDSSYIFSLSMQTEIGPKSVRLEYENGLFRFKANEAGRMAMPQFPGVIELAEYYVRRQDHGQGWADVDDSKQFAPINLKKPLRKERGPLTLKQLARAAINRTLEGKNGSNKLKLVQLGLPTSLMAYLNEWPYSL